MGNDVSIEQLQHCPRCGKDLSQPNLSVSEDVVKDYVRHMLGGRRFSKTFSMFDGAFRVTLEEPTAHEDWQKQQLAGPRELALDKYMLLTLASVEVADIEAGVVKTIYEKTPNERLELIKDVPANVAQLNSVLSTVQQAVVVKCANTFAALLSLIIAEVTSDSFYEGAGLL